MPLVAARHKLIGMIKFFQQLGVTVVELGSSYQSLDEDGLDEVGGVLLIEASTIVPPRMVLDLSQTDYIGSMFLELLVRAGNRLTERGGCFALCGVHAFCAEVLKRMGLDSLWATFPSRDEAIGALAVETASEVNLVKLNEPGKSPEAS